eukprot:SAG11_NODE_1038_length_6076_cov_4.857454_1_plen_122_part_00
MWYLGSIFYSAALQLYQLYSIYHSSKERPQPSMSQPCQPEEGSVAIDGSADDNDQGLTEAVATDVLASSKPNFAPLTAKQLKGRAEVRRIHVPPHRCAQRSPPPRMFAVTQPVMLRRTNRK